MAHLSIRVDLTSSGRLGPGKVALLEAIREHGSISAAGRAMSMSYRRAWLLVADLNDSFKTPLVQAQLGGPKGGGARVTPFGEDLIARYRAIERDAERAASPHLKAFQMAARRQE